MERTSGNEDDETTSQLEYVEESGSFRVSVDWTEDGSISTSIVMAVSEISDLEENALEPLIERIDPDALDDLFAPHRSDSQRDDGVVRFLFADHVVTVYARGEIVIDPPQSGSF